MSSQFDPNSKLANKPQVVPDVTPPQEIEVPSEESVKIEQKLITLRNEMRAKMYEFNRLFKQKVLVDNKTEAHKHEEKAIMSGLTELFSNINSISPDEGTISLLVLCLRHLLSLKDAGNDTAYKIYLLEKSVFGESTEDKQRKKDLEAKKLKLDSMQAKLEEELKELGE
jgi:hypothetical protein